MGGCIYTCMYVCGCIYISGRQGFNLLVESYQRLKKWYLMLSCLTLSIIRYRSMVKWSHQENGVVPSPTPRCWSNWKRSLQVTLNFGRQLHFIYECIWVCVYMYRYMYACGYIYIYIYIYIYCHVISHWDDGSGMTAVWINSNLTWMTSSSPNKIAWPGGGGR